MPTRSDDDAAIRNLLARYCIALDLDDIEEWVSLFTTDSTYEVYGHAFEGHEGLARMMAGAPGGLHLGGPPAIEFTSSDGARSRRNLLFIERSSGAQRSAIYEDDLVRTPEGWRIARCRCQFIVADGLSDRPG
jgi:SnoaL-like domain